MVAGQVRHERGAGAAPAEPRPSRLGFYLTALIILTAGLLGGRAAGTPLSEALFRVLATWLLLWLAFQPHRAAHSWLINSALLLMVATLLIGAFQLIPLPEAWWRSLSGAPVAAELLRLAGEGGGARPISLNIDGTRETILTLLPPFAVFLAVLELDARERQRLAFLLMVVAAISIVIGLLQFSSRSAFYFYRTNHEGYSTGIFSNRNHQADLTLIGALLASAFYAQARREQARMSPIAIVLAAGVLALVVLNIIAAASRTGVLMAFPVIIACAAIAFGDRLRNKWSLAAGTAAVVGLGAYLATRPDLLDRVFRRFGATSDARFETWPTVVGLVPDYLPFGSGLGTFVPAYQAVENLDLVGPRYLNHAHNDYLEIALELGLPGMALVGCFLLLFAWAALNTLRASTPAADRPLAFAAVVSIGVLLAHSVVDYSLRTSCLAVGLALLFGILMPLPAQWRRGSDGLAEGAANA